MLFRYKAFKAEKLVIDKIQADSEDAVLRYLKTADYFPISIWRTDLSSISFNNLFKSIHFNDIVDFTRQLAIMLDAGLTLIDALDILKKQITKQAMNSLIESIVK